jgi:hypothetical protein
MSFNLAAYTLAHALGLVGIGSGVVAVAGFLARK